MNDSFYFDTDTNRMQMHIHAKLETLSLNSGVLLDDFSMKLSRRIICAGKCLFVNGPSH